MTKPQVLRIDHLRTFDPLTENQKSCFDAWKDGNHLMMYGTAGTGKTFLGLYFALEQVMEKSNTIEKLVVVRSVVPTREIGYLPGTLEEKLSAYTAPYIPLVSSMFEDGEAYRKLVVDSKLQIMSTSHIRGLTLDNTIVLVDECQNLTFHELDSIITRLGHNSRIIFAGDYRQSDFTRESDKKGIKDFINIVEQLKNFSCVEFQWQDIVRSDFVRDYIMTKEMLGY
jgi:phosphate starvation-inducible PhoH-like protein|tara:strand:- start:226 stop:903 length:678 start_codon:yes stop_codon:yes gene_type:complete